MELAHIGDDVLAWTLANFCALHRRPFDPSLALQRYPPPHTIGKLVRSFTGYGFKSEVLRVAPAHLPGLPVPYLATMYVPSESQVTASHILERIDTVLVLRCDGNRVLTMAPHEAAPRTLSMPEFLETFAGHVVLATPQDAGIADPDGPALIQKFGFSWFVPELLKHRSIWRDVLLSSLTIQLMALATPLFTQVIIDKVIVHQTQSTLIVLGIALATFMLFTAAMSWVRQYLVLHTGNRVDAVLGARVFAHLLDLSPRYFEQRSTGVVVARLQAVESIREFIASAAITLILDLPFLLIFLAMMLHYSLPLSALSGGILALVLLLSVLVAPLFRRRLNAQFLVGARNQAFVTEYIAGMETVKSLQFEPVLKERYDTMLAELLHASFRAKQLGNTYHTIANALEQAMTLAILCYGAYLVMNSTDFTIGMLVAFQMFASRLSQPLLRLVGLWQQFQQAHIAVARLGDVLNAPPEPSNIATLRDHRGPGRVELRDLAFRYAEHLPFLYRGLQLDLKPGRVVALIGASGVGKSTLAKLLQGFYQPSHGQILIDGKDIRHLGANEIRMYFGVVPQETVLFSGSVYDNLVMANPHATFEQVVAACQRAEIHQTIEQLPQGYRTELGERGVSAWQSLVRY
jgi:ATP-binding cassette, subfamily B, bacterial HlyB/CyaB